MKTTKTLMLAGLTGLSLGVGVAAAQESAAWYSPDSYEARQLSAMRKMAAPNATPTPTAVGTTIIKPQFGASDYNRANLSPVLEGADGNDQ